MRKEHVLVRSDRAGAQRVRNDRGSSSTIEEVKSDGSAVTVGRLERPVEVGEEVDGLTVVDTWGEDTGNTDDGAGELGVGGSGAGEVAETDGIDEEG